MFKVTGVSRCKGSFKVRFANDMSRVKVLIKTGHDEIELLEMTDVADKAGCVNFLKASDLYQRAEFREAIDTADAKYNGSATVKVTATAKAAKPSLDAIKARAVKTVATEQAESTEA